MRLQRRFSKYIAVCCACIAASCGSNSSKPAAAPAAKEADIIIPATISCSIVNEYPHDPAAFTEGLEYKDGFIYESTGQYGASEIRKTDLQTGAVLASQKMEQRYFGEGLTILDGKIYQLTYREGKGFIYDLNTLKPTGSFTIKSEEGWGLTNDGASLIFDNGGNVLHYIDPKTFNEIKALAVTDEQGPVNEINELELIHGFIYANQWKKDLILKIDTATGHVVARADLSALRGQAGISASSGKRNSPDVLNGIAYDAVNNRIFITGKYWPKLFEIKLDN